MGDFNGTAFAVTAERLSEVLGADIVTVDPQRIGDGLVGMNLRVGLTYAPGGDGPASVVIKLPSEDPLSRRSGIELRNYEREVRFYGEVASTVAIRTPRCFHAEWNPDDGEFAVVLEDMAPARQGDQITGCSVAMAEAAVVELARLHAPRWGDSSLDAIEWLSRRTGDDDVVRLEQMYVIFWPGFLATYGPHLDAEQIALGERVGTMLRQWLDARRSPFTVVHGDYRLDNLLFAGAGEMPAAPGAPPRQITGVAAVDWQTPGHGPGIADLSYFLGAGLLVDDRRAHERDLVRAYLAELAAMGVELDESECWQQYRRETLAGIVMSVIASQVVGRTERSEAMFTAMATRHLRHALDLDSLGALL